MKRCPTCNKTYTDQNLSFCVDDGTPLVADTSLHEPELTTPQLGERETDQRVTNWSSPPYQPPSSVVPPGGPGNKRAWPWLVGIGSLLVLALVGLGIAMSVVYPRLVHRQGKIVPGSGLPVAKNNPDSAPNSNTSNSNSNSALSSNTNTNANSGKAGVPTDTELVLSQLTDLENEWTVANINADKSKLETILADDYAGPSGDGQIQGKADYIRNLERDSSIQKWEFKDLKVTLRGDRATLTGRLVLQRDNQDGLYDFIDKFVWRDGRWQATGSEVTPVQTPAN